MADNAADMLQMQQDAIRRVRLMQQKAQRSVNNHAATEPTTGKPSADEKKDAASSARRARLQPRKASPAPALSVESQFIEKLFGGDHERTLLLVLLLVLLDEKTDMSLILSLMYLIL